MNLCVASRVSKIDLVSVSWQSNKCDLQKFKCLTKSGYIDWRPEILDKLIMNMRYLIICKRVNNK